MIPHTNIFVGSGVTSTGVGVPSGYSLIVLSGGVASTTTVSSGGSEYVSNGGATFNDTIASGATEQLYAGGVATSATIQSGGEVDGPGVMFSANISGVASNVSFGSGESWNWGGQVDGGVVGVSAILDQVENGADSGLLVSGLSATLLINGGAAVDITLESGGSAFMVQGTTATGMIISNGGYLRDGSGAISDTTVYSGGALTVAYQGGLDLGTVLSGGLETVSYGGTASNTIVLNGATEVVGSQGALSNGTVSSGGVLSVGTGGRLISTTILAGAIEWLDAANTLAFQNTVSSGAAAHLLHAELFGPETLVLGQTMTADAYVAGETVSSGSVLTLDDPTVDAGYVLSLTTGASMSGAIVKFGGVLSGPGELRAGLVDDAGLVTSIALGDTHGGRAELDIDSGGVASGVLVVGAGDYVVVASGGLAKDLKMTGAPSLMTIDEGGVASGTVLSNAVAAIYGATFATQIVGGGIEYVQSGALATFANMVSGGHEVVSAGGVTSAATVSAGGVLTVNGVGRARQTVVGAGGVLVDNGVAAWSGAGTAKFAGVLSGKGQIVEAGPGTLVLSGVETAYTGQAVVSGGVIELATASGLGTGTFDFAATTAKKTLKLDAAAAPAAGGHFAATLIDFDSSSAAYVDLADVAFAAGATATLAGKTLTLHDGAYTATFTLSGHAASKYAVLSDGAGGTEIRAGIGSTVTPLLVHAMAAFQPKAGAAASTSSAGRVSDVVGLVSPARHRFG
jgi:autotransporter passenger strand-loop-strand repeat protein